MDKKAFLKFLNPLLGLLILNQALTGLLHDAIAPDMYEIVHVDGGIALLLGIVLHLIFNWGWVRSSFFPGIK